MKTLFIFLLTLTSLSTFACQCSIPEPLDVLSEKLGVSKDSITIGSIDYSTPPAVFIALPYLVPKYFLMGKEKRQEAWGACECGSPGERIVIEIDYVNNEGKNCNFNYVKGALKRHQLENYRIRKHYCEK